MATTINFFELLIPSFNAGWLLVGTILFIYLAYKYKSKFYLAVGFLGTLAFLFTLCDAVIAYWGVWKAQIEIGKEFHRLQQLIAVFFLFTLPYLLTQTLSASLKLKKINFSLALIGLTISLIFVFLAYLAPDLFIKMDDRPFSSIPDRVTYLWDREGLLYLIRDILIALITFYSLCCLILDLIKNKRKDLIAILFGILLAIAGATLDILSVWIGHYPLFPNEYFSRFSLGLAAFLLVFMTGVAREYIQLAKEVHRAHELLKLSERKNRILANYTKDCIFTLNDNYFFLSANEQAFKQYHLKKDELAKTSFFDILQIEPGTNPIILNFLKDKLINLKSSKEPICLSLRLKSYLPTESKRYNLFFDYIETEEGNEIIVTASLPQEESYLKYCQAESGRFVIDNYLITVEEISQRLVVNVSKFVNYETTKQIRIGIQEILLNALEHGNLEITSEEKNQALLEDRYFELIKERQNEEKYKNRKITVEYSVGPEKAIFRITDEGKGFNWKSYIAEKSLEPSPLALQGRGILMTKDIFDKITYNEKGSCVTLIKYFNKTA